MFLHRAILFILFAQLCYSSLSCTITDSPFNAKCDNNTDDSPSIQQALNTLSCVVVVVPSLRTCVSRALNISQMSHRTLSIQGELVIWRNPATYSLTKSNNMFISSTDGDGSWTGSLLSNFSINGGGLVLGGGRAWWPQAGSNRPRILYIPNGQDISVSDLTFYDSPAWNMGLRGNRITVERMTVISGADSCGGFGHAPNTDGCNIGGHDIVIRDFHVHNGDDCVPITTGPDGTTSNVLVENASCECGTNGVVVYNEGGTIRDIVARNVTVTNTNQGAGVKLARPGKNAVGGLVTNLTFTDYHIVHPRYAALYINVFQEDAQPPCTLPSKPDLNNWLTVQDLTFSSVTALVDNGQAAGCFRCTPGIPCEINFDGVGIKQDDGAIASPFVCLNTKGVTSSSGSSPHGCPAL